MTDVLSVGQRGPSLVADVRPYYQTGDRSGSGHITQVLRRHAWPDGRKRPTWFSCLQMCHFRRGIRGEVNCRMMLGSGLRRRINTPTTANFNVHANYGIASNRRNPFAGPGHDSGHSAATRFLGLTFRYVTDVSPVISTVRLHPGSCVTAAQPHMMHMVRHHATRNVELHSFIFL